MNKGKAATCRLLYYQQKPPNYNSRSQTPEAILSGNDKAASLTDGRTNIREGEHRRNTERRSGETRSRNSGDEWGREREVRRQTARVGETMASNSPHHTPSPTSHTSEAHQRSQKTPSYRAFSSSLPALCHKIHTIHHRGSVDTRCGTSPGPTSSRTQTLPLIREHRAEERGGPCHQGSRV